MSSDLPAGTFMVRVRDDVTIVRLKVENLMGTVDLQRIEDNLIRLVEQDGCRKLVLDLKHVRYVGSAGLGMIIKVSRLLNAAGGKLVLSHPEHIRPLLKVSRLDHVVEVADDPAEAVKRF